VTGEEAQQALAKAVGRVTKGERGYAPSSKKNGSLRVYP